MKVFQSLVLVTALHVAPTIADYEDNAIAAIKILQNKWYDSNTGLWDKLWWQSGNMVETIARFGIHDADFKQTASDIVSNTHEKAANQLGAKEWHNDYYDDMGWWALGFVASYDLTGDFKYLNTARDLFEDMTGGWTTPCNGGIWWDKKKTSVAAISNELFLSLGAHLANRISGNDKQNYLHWATMEWDWFSKSGVINSDNVINDGVDKSTCKNNGAPVYTYNQGVVLGGLAELAKATGDGTYIDAGKRIANGAINKLTDNGILTEKASSDGNLDIQGAQFKGAFVRGLAALNAQSPDASFTNFLKKNADSAWSKDKDSQGVIGAKWQGGANSNTASHAAGIDVLVAAAQAS